MGRKYGCLLMEAAVFWYMTLYQISSNDVMRLMTGIMQWCFFRYYIAIACVTDI